MVERCIERFIRTEAQDVTVLVAGCSPPPALNGTFAKVSVRVVGDLSSAIAEQLRSYSESGIEHSFISFANVYAEADLMDFFYFHREARQPATRAVDRDGALDLWVVDCAKAQAQRTRLESLLVGSERTGSSYFVRDYIRRLINSADLRLLATDALGGRCAMRPSGREVKPGIWVEDGAEIHRRARIVAPAFVGKNSKIEEDTLITRCSSVERDCCVDCGTVIEDSSILANTSIGIWLDVCHAVAHGNKFLSLGHEVVVDIADPSVLRFNAEVRHASVPKPDWSSQEQFDRQRLAADGKDEQTRAPEAWQFGTNPIGGD